MPPVEYLIDVVCQAFPGMPPSVARTELLETNPNGYIWRMLEYRNYKATKDAIERAPKPDQEPTGPMAEMVNVNAFRMAKRKLEQRQQAETE